jgi:signal transduction histidine kinase
MALPSAHSPLDRPETRILLVARDPEDAELLRAALRDGPPPTPLVRTAFRLHAALRALEREPFDVLVFEPDAAGSVGLEAMQLARCIRPELAVLALTDRDDSAVELELIRSGLQGTVCRPSLGHSDVRRVMERALAHRSAEWNAQQRLQRTLDAERRRGLERVAKGVARDFHDLLVTILGSADLALFDLPSNSPLRDPLRQIERAGRAGAQLTRSLHECARFAGATPERVHVSRLVAHLSPHLPRRAGDGSPGLIFERELAGYERAWVRVDCESVRRALAALVSNACEAQRNSPPRVWLRTGVEEIRTASPPRGSWPTPPKPGFYTYLEVVDEGTGIHAEEPSVLFDPYYSTKPGCRGLGLTAARARVEAEGGRIRVISEPGRGSRFAILLPRAEAAASA